MKRSIYHFSVGNGNCSVIEADQSFVMVIDLNHSEEFDSTYEMLKPYFRIDENDKEVIDILLITHGDYDHCLGFSEFRDKIESGDLIIGTIWHQGYDRRKYENIADLEDDYIALEEELDRRRSITNPGFGDYQEALTANVIPQFHDIPVPEDFEMVVLNPTNSDVEDAERGLNDLSCIVRINLKELLWLLYAGDGESTIWQERIIPSYVENNTLKAESKYFIVPHHGSYTFFDQDRDAVREADPYPDNYVAMNYINPEQLILSAKDIFPTSRDQSGDDPPHYAAWKWYHKWFEDNRSVNVEDKHPKEFSYTSEGHIKLDLVGNIWVIDKDYKHNKDSRLRKLGQKLGSAVGASGITIRGSSTSSVRSYGKV